MKKKFNDWMADCWNLSEQEKIKLLWEEREQLITAIKEVRKGLHMDREIDKLKEQIEKLKNTKCIKCLEYGENGCMAFHKPYEDCILDNYSGYINE